MIERYLSTSDCSPYAGLLWDAAAVSAQGFAQINQADPQSGRNINDNLNLSGPLMVDPV
jgi:hypothetical protein